MKMSEIKVGEEYAIGLGDWYTRHPKRARVLEVNANRSWRTGVSRASSGWAKSANDGVKIVYLNTKGEISQIRPMGVGETQDNIEVVIARAIIKPWVEWVKEDRKGRRAQAKNQREKDARNVALDVRLQKIRDRLSLDLHDLEGAEAIKWKNEYRNEVVIDLESLEALVAQIG